MRLKCQKGFEYNTTIFFRYFDMFTDDECSSLDYIHHFFYIWLCFEDNLNSVYWVFKGFPENVFMGRKYRKIHISFCVKKCIVSHFVLKKHHISFCGLYNMVKK